MRLTDTNVLIYAHRTDADRHEDYRDWVAAMVNGPEPYAVADQAITSMIRIVTNPRVYRDPTPLRAALAFASEVRNQPHARVVSPGARFWEVFEGLCQGTSASGNLIPDACLAAVAIEHGCELISDDRDFARFPGLRWRRPFG